MRFTEFSDEWVQSSFSDVFSILSNNTFSRAELNYETGTYKNIHYGDVLIKYGAHIDATDAIVPYINKTVQINSKLSLLSNGDVVFADTAEDYTVGKAAEIESADKVKTLSGLHTIPCRPKFTFAQRYLGYFVNSPSYHNQLLPFIQGIKVSSISKSHITKTKIHYPSCQEQTKISCLLSLLDERIELQNKIISQYETLIKGICFYVFNQQPLERHKLAECFSIGKAGGTPTSTTLEYYSGDIPFLSISDITSQGKYIYKTEKHLSVAGLKNCSAWIIPKNSLILSMYASVGLVCINKIPITTSQAMFAMVINKHYDIDYLYYYLNYFRETQIHRLLETGTQSNINADIVRNIIIPSYGKRNKTISNLLNSIYNKLNIEKEILLELYAQKAFLLQNLFI